MELRRYWHLLRKWFWLMALGAIIAGAASYAVSKTMTPIYAATATLQVNQAQNPAALAYNDVLLSERLTRTYSELIRKRAVLEEVIRQLDLNQTYETFLKQVSVSGVRDTQLVLITVNDPNPAMAATTANKIAEVFIQQMAESQSGQLSTARQNLRQQLASVEQEIRAAAAALEASRSAKNGRSPEARAAEEARLQNSLTQYQLVYSQLVRSEQELAIAEGRSGAGVRIADPAVPPTEPAQPEVLLNTLLATIVGLLLAIGGILVVEYLDDTVKNSEDLERSVALPTLGIVGIIPARQDANGTDRVKLATDPKLHFSEAYRTLRTNLQFASLNRPAQTLLVTSCGPGEGKTFTICNLAIVMAQAGKRVIIVDSDIRRPAVHKAFGLSNATGLTSLLLAEEGAELERFLQATEYQGLHVLPSGPTPPNPSELLSSPQMARVVGMLRQAADVVLFDSPPALLVADAAILSALVDGILLVVAAGQNRAQAIVAATEALTRPGATILGTVLNRFRAEADGYYYYRHYYRHYYHQEDQPAEGKAAR